LGEERYIYSAEKDEVELSRLRLQESVIDPPTIRHVETIGVSEGWRCLEVGAGAGSIAEWLSSRVGPFGKVVATDIDIRFLGRIGGPNLEVRRHDILKDELEKEEYDLVHCRLLLMHLSESEKALKKMAAAVRPGGWLFVEDTDYGALLSADITDPSAEVLARTLRAMWELQQKRFFADGLFGRRLLGLVERLGFVDVRQDGWVRMFRGGDTMAEGFVKLVFPPGLKLLVAAGLLTQEQAQRQDEDIQRLLMNPGNNWIGPIMFDAWGRKPAGQC
jgi:SAM-dependent methyltransferase